jgi:glycosyltransferase involved in cell wall biosynthesis
MRIALLTTDSRDHFRQYDRTQPYFGTAPQALLQGFAGLQGIEVHVLSCIHQPMASPEKLADNIYYHGLVVPSIGWLKIGYLGCIRAFRSKLQELQPDIVHGQGTERDCAISAVFSGFPNVLTIHGNMRSVAQVNHARFFSFQWCAALLERVTLPKADGIVCISTYTRGRVKSLAKKAWLVPNAVDSSFFEVISEYAFPPTLLCIGNVCFHKNQNALIRSLDDLAERSRFHVVFLGGVNRDEEYGREFLNLVKVRKWCSYEGVVGRSDLKEWLSKASGLILPSLEDNCPMVILEAMAAGVPVAAAAVGGVPDLIEHGKTGLLFDPLNPDSMRTQTKVLLGAFSSQLSATAKEAALLRFHPVIIARKHLEIYQDVLVGWGKTLNRGLPQGRES